jgi:hypothetical protein
MTELTQRPRTAEPAAAVVTQFFDRYRVYDIAGMTNLCSTNADFCHVPVERWASSGCCTATARSAPSASRRGPG